MPIDYTSPVGQVRLLIADLDEAAPTLSDTQLLGYLRLHGHTDPVADASPQVLRRAAADALDAIATSEALVGKVIKTQDVSTDGTKVAAALRAQAATLRQQADDEDALDDGGFIEVAEFTPYPRW